MASATSGATVFTNQGDGTDAWTSTDNIRVQDGTVASCATTTKNDTAQTLACTSFTFPQFKGNNAVKVRGIEVEIWRSASAANTTNDSTVRLIVGGVADGQNKASTTAWPTANTRIVYGGPNDLWGLTNLDSVFANGQTATNFGLAFKANAQDRATLRLDYIGMTIYYQIQDMLYRTNGSFVPVDPHVNQAGSFIPVSEAYVMQGGQWVPVFIR